MGTPDSYDYESIEWWAPELHAMPDERLSTICSMLENGDLEEHFSWDPPRKEIRSRFGSFVLEPLVRFGAYEVFGLTSASLLWDKRYRQACVAIGDPTNQMDVFIHLPDRRPSSVWPQVQELLLDGLISDYVIAEDDGQTILQRRTSPLDSVALCPTWLEFYGGKALQIRLATFIKKLYKAYPLDVKEEWPTPEAWLKAVLGE